VFLAISRSVRPNRILVSVVPEAKPRIRALLPDCELDFVDTYADAALAVKTRRYAAAVIGVHLGHSHLQELARLLRTIQPEARVLAVAGVDRGGLPALDVERQRLEGPYDLAREPLPASALAALTSLRQDCVD
jgi:hypothetical protein